MAHPNDYKLMREIGGDSFSSVTQARNYRARKCSPLAEPLQSKTD